MKYKLCTVADVGNYYGQFTFWFNFLSCRSCRVVLLHLTESKANSPSCHNTVYSPVDIQFDGCPHGKDDVWNIPWSNTERGKSDTQPCPGRDSTGKRGEIMIDFRSLTALTWAIVSQHTD